MQNQLTKRGGDLIPGTASGPHFFGAWLGLSSSFSLPLPFRHQASVSSIRRAPMMFSAHRDSSRRPWGPSVFSGLTSMSAQVARGGCGDPCMHQVIYQIPSKANWPMVARLMASWRRIMYNQRTSALEPSMPLAYAMSLSTRSARALGFFFLER